MTYCLPGRIFRCQICGLAIPGSIDIASHLQSSLDPVSDRVHAMIHRSFFIILLLVATTAAGCRYEQGGNDDLEDLVTLLTPQASTNPSALALSGACSTSLSGSIYTATVNATSNSNTIYCDLFNGGTVAQIGAWDMSFQRFRLGTNSGTSGSGGGGACSTGSTNFSSVFSVNQFSSTTSGVCPQFAVDQNLTATTGGAGGASDVTYSGSAVLQEWFNYNTTTHVLTAKDDVLIIRNSDGSTYYKIQMLDYYSSAGTSGYPSLRWAEIPLN